MTLVLAALMAAAASAQAQTPPTQSLREAQRTFIEAVARHDRGTFEQLLASDTVFLIPGVARGPEAIVKAWSPFLLNTGNSLTIAEGVPVVAGSGDVGYITGTFATANQGAAQSIVAMNGEYVAVWRLVDGRWKIQAFGGATASAAAAGERGGLGGYRFGMTQDDVRRVTDCQPYTNVSQTGGFECANFTFQGRRTNVSFLFANGRLRRIQLWIYEGNEEAAAKDAIANAIDFLRRTAGGVAIGALPGVEVTADRVMAMLAENRPEPARAVQFDLSTPAASRPEVWFGRVARHELGYLVFLMVDPRDGR